MEFEELRRTINEVRRDVEARYPIRLVGVFGSAARGDARADSDVDILVEPGPGLSLFKLGAVQVSLEEALRRPVDLVFESNLNPNVRAQVRAELRRL
jgi:predicted nucleotidyltransferase